MQRLTAISDFARHSLLLISGHPILQHLCAPSAGHAQTDGCQVGGSHGGASSDLRVPAHKIVGTAAQVKHRLAACTEERGPGRHETCHHCKVVASTSPLHIMHRPLLYAVALQRQLLISPSPSPRGNVVSLLLEAKLGMQAVLRGVVSAGVTPGSSAGLAGGQPRHIIFMLLLSAVRQEFSLYNAPILCTAGQSTGTRTGHDRASGFSPDLWLPEIGRQALL